MVSEIRVYREAGRLIAQHGKQAMKVADRAIDRALDRRDADRVLLMLRVRRAIATLQAPPSGPLH
jgi:hypothetical protein